MSRFLLHENIDVNITSPTTCLLRHPSFTISLTIEGSAFFHAKRQHMLPSTIKCEKQIYCLFKEIFRTPYT